jgi:hypothetical protein
MSGEAAITINGERLSDEESHIVRMAVDTFRAVMAQGIEEKDRGVLSAIPSHIGMRLRRSRICWICNPKRVSSRTPASPVIARMRTDTAVSSGSMTDG